MVQTLAFSIADDVFARFPGYVRGVVLAHGVTNGPSPADLIALLRSAEAEVRRTINAATIAEHPRIRSWREAFRTMGAKPSEFRPSIEALARRVLRGDPLPAINALVDLGNVISLRHLLPAGAHAIDELTTDLWLRPAAGRRELHRAGWRGGRASLSGRDYLSGGRASTDAAVGLETGRCDLDPTRHPRGGVQRRRPSPRAGGRGQRRLPGDRGADRTLLRRPHAVGGVISRAPAHVAQRRTWLRSKRPICQLAGAQIGRSGTSYLTDRSLRFQERTRALPRSASALGGVLCGTGSRPLLVTGAERHSVPHLTAEAPQLLKGLCILFRFLV